MLLRLNASALTSDTPLGILLRGLLLLLALSLPCGTIVAQSYEEKWAQAEKLLNEGRRLRREGSKGSLEQALKTLERARQLFRSVKRTGREGAAVATIADVQSALGDKQKALDTYAQALRLFHAAGEPFNEAYALNSIGDIYAERGEKQKALANHEQALSLYRASYISPGEAKTLTIIGKVYDELGEKQKALSSLHQALEVYQADRDQRNAAVTHYNIGKVYDDVGDRQKALDHLEKALTLNQALNEQRGEALTLLAIGKIYLDLVEVDKARDRVERALAIFQAAKDAEGEAYSRVSLGRLYDIIDLPKEALQSYAQALPHFQAVADRRGEAYALNNIGAIHDDLSDKRQALDYYSRALPLFHAIGDRQGEAMTVGNIGDIYNELGEKQKALSNLTQALQLYRSVGDRSGEARTLMYIAIIEQEQGKLAEAREKAAAAVGIFESLRTNIVNPDLRTSYFATVQGYYKAYIDVLMRLHTQRPAEGYDRRALQISERARARALLETLAEAKADIRQGVDPKLVERERSLQRRLDAKAQEQIRLSSDPRAREQAAAVAKEIEALMTESQQVDAQIRQTSPRYAALTQPQPLTLEEIQTEVLDADTLLLEYSLGPDRSYLWAVTPGAVKSYELPSWHEIVPAARRLYDLLTVRNRRVEGETKEERAARVAQSDGEIPAAAATLGKMLLAPVAAQLGKKRLVIVADGVLQYIPFAMLPDPNAPAGPAAPQPLIVAHEVVSLPSASTLAVIRREVSGRKPAPRSVVALADPVFMKSDERVKHSLGRAKVGVVGEQPRAGGESVKDLELIQAAEDTGLSVGGFYVPRLPGSRKEAEEIVAMVPAGEYRLALDFEASRALATSAELSQYRYVHFSTHGFLDSVHPKLSGIVFSLVDERGEEQDGFLRAHEVFNLKLPAEVVVLSACQTGVGKQVAGEGLMSLTRGFMYAGSPRVVVSLWSVSETGTAELMVRFYREMLRGGKRPAEALRAAQLSLTGEKRWQSPFYWAAFTLQGEWR